MSNAKRRNSNVECERDIMPTSKAKRYKTDVHKLKVKNQAPRKEDKIRAKVFFYTLTHYDVNIVNK